MIGERRRSMKIQLSGKVVDSTRVCIVKEFLDHVWKPVDS